MDHKHRRDRIHVRARIDEASGRFSLVLDVRDGSAERRRELCAEQLGADLTAASGRTAIDAVMDATEGRGADVVIESTGHLAALGDAIAMVRPGGAVVLFGIYTETHGALPFYQLYYKEPTIVCARAATADDFPDAIDLVARGEIRLAPLVTQVFPFVRLREALAMLEDDVDGRMKIILEH